MQTNSEKKARRLSKLLAAYIRKTITPEEKEELDEWIGASERNLRLFQELSDPARIKLALEILADPDQK